MGPGTCSDQTAALAEQVGRLIAEADAVLICGGRGGVMEAASRGAAEAGGTVVGILPSDDESTANPFVTLPIVTGMGNARNAINVLTSHVVIAIEGGPGTLSEIALAAKTGTPLVGLDTWTATSDSASLDIHTARDPDDAVSQALRLGERLRDTGDGRV
jgi:uncharacterized protein (TIGR00725 family)